MRRARTGGREADAELARELGVGARHEGRHLLVARLDELDLAVRPIQRLDDAVDAVAGVAEDLAHAPRVKALDDEIPNSLGHAGFSRAIAGRRWGAGRGAPPADQCGPEPICSGDPSLATKSWPQERTRAPGTGTPAGLGRRPQPRPSFGHGCVRDVSGNERAFSEQPARPRHDRRRKQDADRDQAQRRRPRLVGRRDGVADDEGCKPRARRAAHGSCEAATWRRDSGERRDGPLPLSSAGRQNGNAKRAAGRLRRGFASDDPARRWPAEADAGVDDAARGCRLRDSPGPAAVPGPPPGPTRPFEAVFGLQRRESPPTDGVDHASERRPRGAFLQLRVA